jgi:hypothetical protein
LPARGQPLDDQADGFGGEGTSQGDFRLLRAAGQTFGAILDTAAALAWLEARPEITSLRAAVCDLNGILRGKRVPRTQAEKVLEGSMRMPYSIACLDIWGEDVADNPLVWKQGDVDGRCAPTGRGFLPMDWLGTPSALVPLWLIEDAGAPYAGDPRQALAAVVARFDALGLTPVVATELEFYLVDTSGDEPTPPKSPVTHKLLDGDGALCIDDLDHFEAFFTDVYAACDAHGIPVDSAISENGGGQFEINLLHASSRASPGATASRRASWPSPSSTGPATASTSTSRSWTAKAATCSTTAAPRAPRRCTTPSPVSSTPCGPPRSSSRRTSTPTAGSSRTPTRRPR